jgi:energy-coupling factor transporter ATP-binding protein EcfA2
MDYRRGSTWRKWDLHLHSPCSFLNNKFPKNPDGTPDWEKYIDEIESKGEIGVLGITDYFSIEGYKKLKEFKANGRLQNVHKLLPNIELRLDNFVDNKRINFHVIFSEDDKLTSTIIEEQFLGNLDFVYENRPQDTQYKMRVNEVNLTDLGRKIKAEESSQTGSDIEVGAGNAVVSLKNVIDILTTDKRFNNKYVLVVAEQLWADIPWQGQDHQTRKTLLQASDMVFSSNAKTAQWCTGKDPYMEGEAAFRHEFKTLKPCIHGSDAHEIGEILRPCAFRGKQNHTCDDTDCQMRFCWVKADPSFEGLKQLLYEPEDRVAIQPTNPTSQKSGLSLKSIKINNSSIDKHLKISGAEIPLNGDLIAVTGAKGSGKTAFVDLIANCYVDRKESEDPNSFVKRISSNKGVNVEVSLEYLGGNKFSKDLLEGKFVDFADITYIAQAELEEAIFKSGGLNSQIHEVVFNSKDIKDSQLEFEFKSLRDEKTFLKDRIKKLNELIINLESSTSSEKVTEIATYDKKAKEVLKDKKQKLTELEKSLSKGTIKLAKEKQEDVQKLKLEKSKYEATLTNLRELGDKVEYELSTVNSSIKQINLALQSFDIKQAIPEIEIDTQTYQPIFNTISKQIHTKLSKTITNLKANQEVVEKLESTTKSHATLSQEIKDLEHSIEQNELKSKKLQADKTELKELEGRRNDAFEKMLEVSMGLKEKYTEITNTFGNSKGKILEDVEFSANIHFDKDKFVQLAEEIFDLRSVNTNDEKGSDIFDALEAYRKIQSGNKKDIPLLTKELGRICDTLKSKLKRSPNVNLFSLYRFLYGEYLSVRPSATYKSVEIDKLSLGQKATVLIKVYLAQGEHPIIIDSHDDHLDNAFIMDELVPALREAKKTRQVIIVSNNGNVVINSDAEQLIIARKNNSEIEYIAGSLEDEKIRSVALKVLEGGHIAFKKRQKKYRIS